MTASRRGREPVGFWRSLVTLVLPMPSSLPGLSRLSMRVSAMSMSGLLAVLLPGPVLAQSAVKAPQGALLPRDSSDAAVFRGGLVFANYCVTCHGINADGNGRAARLYNPKPANLRSSEKNDAYFGLIVRMGGGALGRSEFMPSWEAELTNEQIADLVSYLRSINATKN